MFKKGFINQDTEIFAFNLPVQDKLPDWLDGSQYPKWFKKINFCLWEHI